MSYEMTATSLNEIADYFDTLASDQRNCIRFQPTKKEKAECITKALVWENAANILRTTRIVP